MTTALMVHAGAERIGRQDLPAIICPPATDTFKPVPHHALVEAIVQALAYRKVDVVSEEYAVSSDGMRIFGALAVNIEHDGIRLAVSFRNSHDKSFSLGLIAGYRVFCCDNLAFHGDFVAIARKHSKNLDIVETMAIGIDRIQRKFDEAVSQVNVWKGYELPDVQAKAILCDAFVAGELEDVPKHLARQVHKYYFDPEFDEFKPRTLWSLSNAFTSAFKLLEPVPQFKATTKLAPFMERYN
jgi:uncharacterized protein DUF932